MSLRSLKVLLLLVFVGGLIGCAGTFQPISQDKYLGFQPVEPKQVNYYVLENGEKCSYAKMSNNEKLMTLPVLNTSISVMKISANGSLSYLPVSIAAEKGVYVVTIDFANYRIESVLDQDQKNNW